MYPFSAVVGQEEAQKALLLNLICPAIGGVFLFGQKGAGKSTLARSLGRLLPGTRCINLPVTVTEERLLGGLDWEATVKTGRRVFAPGLLSVAHGNILCLDDANLLPQAVLKRVLETHSTGKVFLEREGFSQSYSSSFCLVATLNPEEGLLPPHLLDHFGLGVEVQDITEPRQRAEIVRRNLAFEFEPEAFLRDALTQEDALGRRILEARKRLPQVRLPVEILALAIRKSMDAKCPGSRGEFALTRAAKAWAAWEGCETVTEDHIHAISGFALTHRALVPIQEQHRQQGTQTGSERHSQSTPEKEDETSTSPSFMGTPSSAEATHGTVPTDDLPPFGYEPSQAEAKEDPESGTGQYDTTSPQKTGFSPPEDIRFEILKSYSAPDLPQVPPKPGKAGPSRGRGQKSRSSLRTGYSHGSRLPADKPRDIAWDATLKQALFFQSMRPRGNLAVSIHREDIREKVRRGRTSRALLFLVDASGSMGARQRMAAAKGCIFAVLEEAYRRRDRAGMMVFRQRQCRLILPMTRSLDLAHRLLEEIPTGGETPLALGLRNALDFCRAFRIREPQSPLHVLLFSDGRANFSSTGENPLEEALDLCGEAARENMAFTVVDTETGYVRLGLAERMAHILGAAYQRLEDLQSGQRMGREWEKI